MRRMDSMRGPAVTKEVFEEQAGNPRLTQDYLTSFGADAQFSVHLMHRTALDLPNWLQKITGRDASHLYLSIRDPEGNEITQIHGLPHDDQGNSNITGSFCNHLRTVFGIRDTNIPGEEIQRWDMSAGELAVKMGRAAQRGDNINRQEAAYRPYLPFFQGTNSNTVAREIMQAMGLELPKDVEGRWWNEGRIWAPGFANKDAFRQSVFNTISLMRYEDGMSVEQAFATGLSKDMTRLSSAYVSDEIILKHGDAEVLLARGQQNQNVQPAFV